jgi:hypothetical protein
VLGRERLAGRDARLFSKLARRTIVPMASPVMMVADDNPGGLQALDDTLRHRYGQHTDWLPPGIGRDEHGFIVTGSEIADGQNPAASWPLPRAPLPLETSLPGVFAAGDVRHGSVKRVASAVGEGSIATTQMTQYLQKQAELP